MTGDGKPITAVPLGNRTVLVAVWRAYVGRVTLYLLDTDLEENAPWIRELSARLYGGDRETRVQQEIILGIGGVRVLKALGCSPSAYHLNEGHAAFVVLQRIRDLCEAGELRTRSTRSAGLVLRDAHAGGGRPRRVPVPLVETHLAGAWGDLGPYRERFLALSHYDNGGGPMFNMTALALRVRRGQRREPSPRRGHQADVAGRSGQACRSNRCPCDRSPTASTCRRGSPPRSARSSRRHLGATGSTP